MQFIPLLSSFKSNLPPLAAALTPRLQRILRVQHPERRQDFRNSDEMHRQIRPVSVRLHELAFYVSPYRVAGEMIVDIESLLIRAFPNDLLNKKIENLTWK